MKMLPKFETKRLRLRGLEKGDEDFLVQLEVSEQVMAFVHEGAIDTKLAERYVSLEVQSYSNPHSRRRTGKWMVELPNTDTRIGWVEVSRAVVRDEEFRCIGYEFAPEFWGSGYATEAVRAVVAYLFESLNARAVVAYTRPENHRSARVLQKVGFRSRGEQNDDGASIPCDVYEISLVEWQELEGTRAAEIPPALDG
jgi:ribosomal-protein-alanine N-acetyltransferase